MLLLLASCAWGEAAREVPLAMLIILHCIHCVEYHEIHSSTSIIHVWYPPKIHPFDPFTHTLTESHLVMESRISRMCPCRWFMNSFISCLVAICFITLVGSNVGPGRLARCLCAWMSTWAVKRCFQPFTCPAHELLFGPIKDQHCSPLAASYLTEGYGYRRIDYRWL